MPTILATKQEAARLEAECRGLAEAVAAGACVPGASEVERLNAESAAIIIEIAEQQSRLIPASVLADAVEQFHDVDAELHEIADEALAADPAIDRAAVAQHALAVLDLRQDAFQLRLAEHVCAAWREAILALAPLVPRNPVAAP